MQPRLNPSLIPAFHELGEYEFQSLCCDVFAEEEFVATCDIYGKRGQSQRGIDLLAPRRDGDGNEVAQCKCCVELSAGEIKTASDVFFEHLHYWKERKVKRFVLIAACPLDRTQEQDAIQEQRVRFAQHDIAYEAWSAGTLQRKLAPYRSIAERHISSRDVVDGICGAHPGDIVQLPAGGAHWTLVVDAAGSQIAQLSTALSREKSARLEEARDLFRRGQRKPAYDLLCAIRDDVGWNALEVPLRARVFRILASCVVDTDDGLERARALADEAHALDPAADDSLLRALLRYHEEGPRAALDRLPLAHDVDTLNYRLGLLLELGESEQALATLQGRSTSIAPNADTLRLQALALLTREDIAGAQQAIDQAIAEQPEWEGVRMATGMVDYYSALSPAALPEMLSAVPGPVPWDYVKRDDASVTSLRTAEGIFASLAATSERPPDQRRSFAIWRLACLATDTGRQAEAADLCKALLIEMPGDPYVLMWALARSYDFDPDAAMIAIGRGVENADEAAILVGIQVSSGKVGAALETLDRTKGMFVVSGVLERWLFLRTQGLIVRGDLDAAAEVAKSAEDPAVRRQLEILVLQAKFDRDRDWQELLMAFETALAATGDPRFLYEACSLKAQLEDWGYVADRSEQLVASIGTPTAVHLAAGSLWNAGRSAACLDLLNRHISLFPRRCLPGQLRRLRIECMQQVGQISRAAVEAQAFAHEDPSTDSLLTSIQAQIRTGDLKGGALSARSLLVRGDAPVGELLRVGRLLVSEDPQLAERLWRCAVKSLPLEAALLIAAVDLAFALGLEDEARPLLQHLHVLAAEGSPAVQRVEFSDLLSLMRSGAERFQRAESAYRSGRLPVHAVGQVLNVPLVALVPGIGRKNRVHPNPRKQAPLLIRHGGRGRGNPWPAKESSKRLYADVTALLIAYDLGILDAVEKCFRPLRVSPSCIPALLAQLDALKPSQPAQLATQAHVLELVDLGILEPFQLVEAPVDADPELIERMGNRWVGLLANAQNERSYLVEYLPLTSHDEHRARVALNEAAARTVINCRTLADALRRDGRLSSHSHTQAIERLGTEGSTLWAGELPPGGSVVTLVENIAGVLASSGLLDLVGDHFRTRIDPHYVEHIRAEARTAAANESLRIWLRSLVDRLQIGLSAGTYETFGREGGEREGDQASSPEVQALRDLLSFDVIPDDVVWVDDRYINSFSNRDSAAIIGVLEVLQALRTREALCEEEYFETLLNLRASNARYIPLTAEEILYHVLDAPLSEDGLVETPALATLRRYLAASFLDSATLQHGPKPNDWSSPFGELAFIFETISAISQAISCCFGAPHEAESATQRADWIFFNLYTGLFGVRDVIGQASEPGLEVVGRDFAGALLSSLAVFDDSDAQTRGRRATYLSWLGERLLNKRLRSDRGVAQSTVLALKPAVVDKAEAYLPNTLLGIAYRAGLQQVFLEAPEAIREEIFLDPELRSLAGVAKSRTIKVGSATFDTEEFLRAAAHAVNGREGEARAKNPTANFRAVGVSRPDAGLEIPTIELSQHNGSIRHTVSDARFLLLLDSPADREAALRMNPAWFDCGAARFDHAISEIVSTRDPVQRLERLEKYITASAAQYYARIDESIRSGEFHISAIMPPTALGLMNHFRLNSAERIGRALFHDELYTAGSTLIAELGIHESLARLAYMPVRLPAPIIDAIATLSKEDRSQLLTEFERRHCFGPVPHLHMIGLAARFLNDGGDVEGILSRSIDRFFGPDGDKEFTLFDAILRRVHSEFSDWPQASNWPAGDRLAVTWAHAAKLQTILRPAPDAMDEVAAWIEYASSRIGGEPLSRDPYVWNDILHPRLLRREDLLTSGLAAVLQGIEPRTLNQFGIPERVRSVLLARQSEPEFPALALLKDPCLATNSADSIFGGDRGLALQAVLGEETAKIVSSDALHDVVQRCLGVINEDAASQSAWATMAAVVCDLPIYEDLREELRSILIELDLDELWARDTFSAFLAIRFCAAQAAHLDEDPLRIKIERAAVKLAMQLDNWKPTRDNGESALAAEGHASNLVESALRVTHHPRDQAKTSIKLSALLVELVDESNLVCDALSKTARRIVWEVPAEQLRSLWQVELELRARAANGSVR